MKTLIVLAIILACAAAFSPVFAGDCHGCAPSKVKFQAAPPAESKCLGRFIVGPAPSCAPYHG